MSFLQLLLLFLALVITFAIGFIYGGGYGMKQGYLKALDDVEKKL